MYNYAKLLCGRTLIALYPRLPRRLTFPKPDPLGWYITTRLYNSDYQKPKPNQPNQFTPETPVQTF